MIYIISMYFYVINNRNIDFRTSKFLLDIDSNQIGKKKKNNNKKISL